MKSFVEQIKNSFPFLEKDDISLLLTAASLVETEADKVLLREGDINTNIFIVVKGLLRTFVTTSNGEERTLFLSKETDRTVSLDSFLYNKPSKVTIESIEPSVVLMVDSKRFPEFTKANNNITSMVINGMKHSFTYIFERLYSFTVLTPEERFINLRENHPDLIQRVPQKYLASYLGITTVSLSRIKARTAKK